MPAEIQARRLKGRRHCLLAAALLIGTLAVAIAERHPGHWLLVTAPAIREELAPLIEHRRAEGFLVTVLQTTDLLTPGQIRQTNSTPLQKYIRQFCLEADSRCYILLAGASAGNDPATMDQTVLPALFGTIERMNGQLSDYHFAPPVEPQKPPTAVGRFPARTPSEARTMVQNTLKLERDAAPGDWRSRLVLLLGNPGGGALAEMMADTTFMRRLPRINHFWNVRTISCSGVSRYYLPGHLARDAFLRELEHGSLFSAFMGHSSAQGMWLSANDFMTRADWTRVSLPAPGVFFTCGCFALQLQENDRDGYGLTAMRQPNGPAAVIGATAESYAAPGLLAADGLLRCFGKPPYPVRLADYWLSVQAGLATGAIDPITFNLYDQVDGSKGQVPLDVQRLEHLEMWMLLGDPALRLPPTPLNLALNIVGELAAGQSITISGVLPESISGATVQVTMERPLASHAANLMPLPADTPGNAAARTLAILDNHERANARVLAAANHRADGNTFSCTLTAPMQVPWSNLVIRAEATAAGQSVVGIVNLPVSPPHDGSRE